MVKLWDKVLEHKSLWVKSSLKNDDELRVNNINCKPEICYHIINTKTLLGNNLDQIVGILSICIRLHDTGNSETFFNV